MIGPTGEFLRFRECVLGVVHDTHLYPILQEAPNANAVTIFSACVTILQHVVEAMDPTKSRILIDDAIVPNFLGPESLRIFNLLDMYMLANLNGKERTEKQWRELFKATDERLVVKNIWEEKNGGHQGGRVIELCLKSQGSNGVNDLHKEANERIMSQNALSGIPQEFGKKSPEPNKANGVHRGISEESAEQNVANGVHQEVTKQTTEQNGLQDEQPELSKSRIGEQI